MRRARVGAGNSRILYGKNSRTSRTESPAKESLDLCLACKGECPVNVDVATYKAEFLSHYYAAHPRPLKHYAFGMMDKWALLASFGPGLVNAVNDLPLGRIIESLPKRNSAVIKLTHPFVVCLPVSSSPVASRNNRSTSFEPTPAEHHPVP